MAWALQSSSGSTRRGELPRGRLLGGMGMIRTAVHLQLRDHGAPERTLREHALDREAHDALGVAAEQVLERLLAQTTRIAGMAVVALVGELARADRELGRVDHDHVIAGVD